VKLLRYPRRALRRLGFLLGLRALPPRVAWFYWCADRAARRACDHFSLDSVVRPTELGHLIALARGRERVVELGTGTAWTAIALALSDHHRVVITYDPVVRPERELFLHLVGADVRARIELMATRGKQGAEREVATSMIFIDSSHAREETIAEFESWRRVLATDGIVVFHDYRHPLYPGVAEAIEDLGLEGETRGSLFIWRSSENSGERLRAAHLATEKNDY
jgi:SAM-dependent methyltransferase